MPLVLITGYAMIFAVFGGFARLNWAINVMHLLGLIMTAVFLYVVFVPWPAMRAAPSPQAVDRIRRLVQINLLLGTLTLIVAAWAG